MREILVGTSGFSYDDWEGSFYPNGLDPSRRLAFYAERFPIVEVNYTHYRMPERAPVRRLGDRMLDAELQAAVFKAPRTITHEAMPDEQPLEAADLLDAFYDGVEPIAEVDLLDGLLFQFSHTADPEVVLAGVEQATKRDPPAPLFVEVRHASFNEDRHHERLRELVEPEGALVATDSPAATITRAPPNENAYFRFHGRNEATWFDEEPEGEHGSARYDDLYEDEEITELADRVRACEADRVHVFFNNHPGGKAPLNARQLMDALGIEPPEEQVTLEDF